MKTYREHLKKIYNNTHDREPIEWGNTWIDKASDTNTKRILLVGESTSRMVRSTLARLSGYAVDMIGTSSRLDDELFVNQIDSYFNNFTYKYDAIVIQIGHHGREPRKENNNIEQDYQEFREAFDSLVTYLKNISSNIIVETIFDSIIPNKNWHKFFIHRGWIKEKKDDEINSVTTRRNRIMQQVAQAHNLKFLDINPIVDRTNYIHIDHTHFEDKAKAYIAAEMLKVIE
ncbi:MAG: SGNH/GDSL hydrolase family protein [Bacteroidaceae bacterium]|nr:SGNH/GDSL hydrolase family protein [Bacteroidaceae bacterium]